MSSASEQILDVEVAKATKEFENTELSRELGVAQVRVKDLRAVLTAALADEQVYGWLAGPLSEAVSRALSPQAREMDSELEKIVPGIEVYRETVYARKERKTEAVTINRVPIEGSSQIHSAGYKDGILEVQFKRKDGEPGDVWNYHGVPATLYAEFIMSDSKGKFLNAEIKGKHDARKSA